MEDNRYGIEEENDSIPNATDTIGQAIIDEFISQYEYLSEGEVMWIYKKALGVYLSLSYPFDKSITELKESDARDAYLIIRAMELLLERKGASSAYSYSENGMSMTFGGSDFDSLSKMMSHYIIPEAKVIKR